MLLRIAGNRGFDPHRGRLIFWSLLPAVGPAPPLLSLWPLAAINERKQLNVSPLRVLESMQQGRAVAFAQV